MDKGMEFKKALKAVQKEIKLNFQERDKLRGKEKLETTEIRR